MANKVYKGKITNFWSLINEHEIEIPIIQRDYAQGRVDKVEVRDSFLSAIHSSVNTSQNIRLDFIYGSIVNKSFQPLDGQQRLTTLFLLHWYSAMKEAINVDLYESVLVRFKYETRISSREFCESLIRNAVKISAQADELSHKIIDSSWFFLSWRKDPTIDAMLRMIDDIHKKFYDVENLWSKLTSHHCLIDFYHVDLEDIGLTDDLYIKMNARGKLLSSFENFKATFEKYIIDNKWENHIIKSELKFANKVDSKWTDLFWTHKKGNTIDNAFMRFISTICMIRASLEKSSERINLVRSLQDDYNFVRPENFTEESFTYLCKVFDLYQARFNDFPEMDIPFFQHSFDYTLFASITTDGGNASYTQKVLFFAQIEYLRINDEVDNKAFLDWMRVVRNIVSRGDVTKNGKRPAIIRSPETFEGVINLINELSAGCADIYNFLANNKIKSTFAREQVEEERVKADIIISNPDSKSVIHDTEDTNLLQGRIEFALTCINYDYNPKNFNIGDLRKVQSVLVNYFNNESDINNDFRRAMLTISDSSNNYAYYGYWWSFWKVVSANKRCLIDKFRELEYFIYGNYKGSDVYRDYFKVLVNKLCAKSLREIIDDFNPPDKMPRWKVKLIKENQWLDTQSKSNYIAIPEDEKCCYLLKSIRARDEEGCVKVE